MTLLESVFEVREIDPLPFVIRGDGDCTVDICPIAGDGRPTSGQIAAAVESASWHGVLVDVSMSGVALHLAEQIAPGTRIALRIVNRTIDRDVKTSAVVLRCRPDADAGWGAVCRFEKNLTFEQLRLVGRNLFAATIV